MLQKYVCAAFTSMPAATITSTMRCYIATVVQPSLAVECSAAMSTRGSSQCGQPVNPSFNWILADMLFFIFTLQLSPTIITSPPGRNKTGIACNHQQVCSIHDGWSSTNKIMEIAVCFLIFMFSRQGLYPQSNREDFPIFSHQHHTGCALCVLGVIASAGRDLGIIDGWGDGNKGLGQAQPFFFGGYHRNIIGMWGDIIGIS